MRQKKCGKINDSKKTWKDKEFLHDTKLHNRVQAFLSKSTNNPWEIMRKDFQPCTGLKSKRVNFFIKN